MLGMTSIPDKSAWRDSTGVAMLLPGAKWMRSCMPPWMQQRLDLEGRGTSLQAIVQAEAKTLQKTLPNGLPASIPEVIPESIPQIFPRVLPKATPQQDPKMVSPDRPSNGMKSYGKQPDDKLVH
jgi:hypothetical protein